MDPLEYTLRPPVKFNSKQEYDAWMKSLPDYSEAVAAVEAKGFDPATLRKEGISFIWPEGYWVCDPVPKKLAWPESDNLLDRMQERETSQSTSEE